MAKTIYKVGDKVRILDAKKIYACEAKDGDILKVIDVDFANEPVLLDTDGERLSMLSGELKYIEKVAEQVTKFKVGGKVRVVNAEHSTHSNGDEGTLVSITPFMGETFYDVDVDGVEQGHYAEHLEIISQKSTKNQRITTLEQAQANLEKEVEALKSEVAALKAAQSIEKSAEAIVKVIEKHTPKSPNEQRKAIIAEAKAFVTERFFEGNNGVKKVISGYYGHNTVEFVVNEKKRTVVAILRLAYANKRIVKKAIAKCAPTDVFNADIGKAIALGRALGLDVKRFEQAVQPTEVVAGMSVKNTGSAGGTYEIKGVDGYKLRIERAEGGKYFTKYYANITDDTEAQY